MTEARANFDVVGAHEPFMRAAIDAARRALLAGEPPVGACLVRDGAIVATSGNSVIGDLDATAHAEIRVIREACTQQRALSLAGCTLYATVEPCLMCLTACHYADIGAVVFGATLDDMHAVTGNELHVPHATLVRGGFTVVLNGPCLRAECVALLDEWSRRFRR